jgi:hypothetical protein
MELKDLRDSILPIAYRQGRGNNFTKIHGLRRKQRVVYIVEGEELNVLNKIGYTANIYHLNRKIPLKITIY